MRPAHVIEIITPKKFLLNGLWFGPTKPKRAIIMIHGLTGSAFGMANTTQAILDSDADTAVLTFNNRGFKSVTDIKRKRGAKTEWKIVGAAHEVFTECLDDIQGAIDFAKKQGVKEIYLAGHSTGCQKAMYWASKKKGKGIQGVILFGPLSDWAGETKADKNGTMMKATKLARQLVKSGKPHELLPRWTSSFMLLDAQRYLSLYTPDSPEEIFSYAQPKKKPKTYESVRVPVLTIFAGSDEYADRSAEEMQAWFIRYTRSSKFQSTIIPKVGHSFKGGETQVAQVIQKWINAAK